MLICTRTHTNLIYIRSFCQLHLYIFFHKTNAYFKSYEIKVTCFGKYYSFNCYVTSKIILRERNRLRINVYVYSFKNINNSRMHVIPLCIIKQLMVDGNYVVVFEDKVLICLKFKVKLTIFHELILVYIEKSCFVYSIFPNVDLIKTVAHFFSLSTSKISKSVSSYIIIFFCL